MIGVMKGVVVIFAGATVALIGAAMIITDLLTSDLCFILPSHSFFPPTELCADK